MYYMLFMLCTDQNTVKTFISDVSYNGLAEVEGAAFDSHFRKYMVYSFDGGHSKSVRKYLILTIPLYFECNACRMASNISM